MKRRVDRLWFLDDVHADDRELARAPVLAPVGDVTRLRDDLTRLVLPHVAALPELRQCPVQDVGERRPLLVAVYPSDASGLEHKVPHPQLIARIVRGEV